MTNDNASGSWRARLGMGFGEFWQRRQDAHFVAAMVGVFLAIWISVGSTMGDMHWLLAVLLSFIVAMIYFLIYELSCLFIVPLLPVVLVTALTVALEAWWRVHTNRLYVPPPPAPALARPARFVSPPPSAPAPVQPKKRGGWLIPLAIGLWIGSSWGGDD
ncbi:MAG: hypothetical protein LDL44_16970 [Caenispirillum sp.]|nr:hypothetical protein [Caenispirillum sp.]